MKRLTLFFFSILFSFSMISCSRFESFMGGGSGDNEQNSMLENVGDQFDESHRDPEFDMPNAVIYSDGNWITMDSYMDILEFASDKSYTINESLLFLELDVLQNIILDDEEGSDTQGDQELSDDVDMNRTSNKITVNGDEIAVGGNVVGIIDGNGELDPDSIMGIIGSGGSITIGGSGGQIGIVGGDGGIVLGGGSNYEDDSPYAMLFFTDGTLRVMDINETMMYYTSEGEMDNGTVILKRDTFFEKEFWGEALSEPPECDHNWVVPDPDQYNFCTAFREICALCGEFRGEFVSCEYNIEDYTCTETANCIHCGKPNEDYDIPGHTMIEASCEHPRMCEICGYSEGEALGHTGGKATCTEYAICTRCNWFYGEVLGHEYVNGRCWRCGDDDPNAAPDTSQIPDNDNIKVSHFGPIPFQLHTAKIEAATYEVEGTSIFVTVTVRKTIGDGDVDFGWILYGGGYDDLCKGNETTPFLKEGESVNYLFEIPNAITSEFNSYKVYLGYGYNI